MNALSTAFLGAMAYMGLSLLGGFALPLLGLRVPALPEGTDLGRLLAVQAGAALLLGGAAWTVARGLHGSQWARWAILALFAYVTIGINTVLECLIFTHFMDHAVPFALLQPLAPAAGLAWVATRRTHVPDAPSAWDRRGLLWRVLAAWLAFPCIYWIFGNAIAPFVLPFYQGGTPNLFLPSRGTLLGMQTLRGALFLGASLPILRAWQGTRRSLFLALAVAHTVMVGLYGLVQAADWFPPLLQVVHSLEITADSVAYAGVLVLLLDRRIRLG